MFPYVPNIYICSYNKTEWTLVDRATMYNSKVRRMKCQRLMWHAVGVIAVKVTLMKGDSVCDNSITMQDDDSFITQHQIKRKDGATGEKLFLKSLSRVTQVPVSWVWIRCTFVQFMYAALSLSRLEFSYLYVYLLHWAKHNLHLLEGNPFTAVHFYSVNLYLCSKDQNKVATFCFFGVWSNIREITWLHLCVVFYFCSNFSLYILWMDLLNHSHEITPNYREEKYRTMWWTWPNVLISDVTLHIWKWENILPPDVSISESVTLVLLRVEK